MQKILPQDNVVVSSGKYRGKKGKVIQVFDQEKLVVVEGVNKIQRHLKPQQRGESGQRIEIDGPMSIANVSLVCAACGKPTRVGFSIQGSADKKKKVRMCKKCNKPVSVTVEPTKKKS